MDAVKDDMNRPHRPAAWEWPTFIGACIASCPTYFDMVGFRLRGLLQRAVSTLGSTLHVKSCPSLFRCHVTFTPFQFLLKPMTSTVSNSIVNPTASCSSLSIALRRKFDVKKRLSHARWIMGSLRGNRTRRNQLVNITDLERQLAELDRQIVELRKQQSELGQESGGIDACIIP